MGRGAGTRGVIAAGHPVTAAAAEDLLRAGGNAFDAVLAGMAAACVSEPVLASLGGGGFLLARPAHGSPVLYDFFVQTPGRHRPETDLDFSPIVADFGEAQQEFHIGHGTIAVPGAVRGLFEIHRDLGTVPMREVLAPAATSAREGVVTSAFQAYLFDVVRATMSATQACRDIFGSRERADKLVIEGERLRQPAFADSLEILAIEGDDLFYRGEMASRIVSDTRDGGLLSLDDLAGYRVERRRPLSFDYRDVRVLTNPPPSSGGMLTAFATRLLEAEAAPAFGEPAHVERLAQVMELTQAARLDAAARGDGRLAESALLDPAFVALYRERLLGRPRSTRGTTHLSIIDGDGNLASLTISNGEGSGYVVPETGIVLNNMLGEEDLNPGGFHRWPAGERMTSMMSPTAIAWPGGRMVATGSGGSNRIRSAVLQVVANLVEHDMALEEAVTAPRLHFERGLLSVEGCFDLERIAPALEQFPEHQVWEGRNMFFGGAHTVSVSAGQLDGAGDERRGGVCVVVGA